MSPSKTIPLEPTGNEKDEVSAYLIANVACRNEKPLNVFRADKEGPVSFKEMLKHYHAIVL